MNDREDVDLVLDQGIVDTIGKLPEGCPSDVAVRDGIETWILLDSSKRLSDSL
jgi:hypothetical protein